MLLGSGNVYSTQHTEVLETPWEYGPCTAPSVCFHSPVPSGPWSAQCCPAQPDSAPAADGGLPLLLSPACPGHCSLSPALPEAGAPELMQRLNNKGGQG